VQGVLRLQHLCVVWEEAAGVVARSVGSSIHGI
jgi:hypothetical protein